MEDLRRPFVDDVIDLLKKYGYDLDNATRISVEIATEQYPEIVISYNHTGIERDK